MEKLFQKIFSQLPAPGIFQYGTVPSKQLEFSEEVRKLCADNVCGRYNKSWTCPPAIGTVEECRAVCLNYSHMVVFNQVFPLEDSFDYPGMIQAMKAFGQICRSLDMAVVPYLSRYRILANEGCSRCRSCTYPDAPCRFPREVYPALEGFGLYVNKLAQSAGLTYVNGKNTVTYFGALLFDQQEAEQMSRRL